MSRGRGEEEGRSGGEGTIMACLNIFLTSSRTCSTGILWKISSLDFFPWKTQEKKFWVKNIPLEAHISDTMHPEKNMKFQN